MAVAVLALLVVGLGLANIIPGFHLTGNPTPKPSHLGTNYTISFQETGLPDGTTWSVSLGGTSHQASGTTISFAEPNGSFSYTVATISGYTASPSQGTQTVAGSDESVPVTFARAGSGSLPPAYPVTFEETGLPAGTNWAITFNGSAMHSTVTSIVVHAGNGSWPYSMGSVPDYSSSPSSGTVTVHGAAEFVSITFLANVPNSYAVNFTEGGLPVGTNWSVALKGFSMSSTGSTITFDEINGSYHYTVGAVPGYTSAPSSGTVVVSGAPRSVSIAFTALPPPPSGYYSLTFSQAGLPSDLTWEAVGSLTPPVGSSPISFPSFGSSGDGAEIVLNMPNGTYYWAIPSVSVPNGTSYNATPASGSVRIAGASTSISVQFGTGPSGGGGSSSTYPVTVTETGLPSGSYWGASAGGATGFAAAGSTLNLSIPNGTYVISSFTTAGGFVAASSPSVTIAGTPVSATIHFVVGYLVSFNATGIANGTYWELDLNGSLALGVGPGPISMTLANGSYSYAIAAFAYRASPASGTVSVAGRGSNISITFTALPMYTVTYLETGLPSGTGWGASAFETGEPGWILSFVFAASGGTNGGSFDLSLPDGNYSWSAGTNNTTSYWAEPAAGGFAISGAGTSISITFSDLSGTGMTPVAFIDLEGIYLDTGGLPNGTSWGVVIGGVTYSTSALLQAIVLSNGTYTYTIVAPSGYWALPGGGTFVLDHDFSTDGVGLAIYLTFYSGSPPTALSAGPPDPDPAPLSGQGTWSTTLVASGVLRARTIA
ncbi:MAG TPA: hypothetical protein VGS23_02765 [Thermoplasmata archaeon]|nr:hypothetical protein [Thermoplasmata archaeon]